MKFFFLLLSLVPFLTFGKVVCIEVEEGKWLCQGDGFGDQIVTNVLGVCTNCTAMSPAQCESLKANVLSSVDAAIEAGAAADSNARSIKQYVENALNEYNSFGSMSTIGTSAAARDAISSPVGQYLISGSLHHYDDPSTSVSSVGVGAAANSIKYFTQESVIPLLTGVAYDLDYLSGQLSEQSGDLYSLKSMVTDNLDCSECQAIEPGGPGLPSDPSDPGTGGGSSSSCCGPCVEQLRALNTTANDIASHVAVIDETTKQISYRLEAFQKQVHSDLTGISNLVYRIDDFVRTDIDKYLANLKMSVYVLSNNVDGIQREFFTRFQYAESFKDKNGENEFNPAEISTNFFEVGEYKNLSWASRVEALLLSIAKPFSSDSGTLTNVSDQARQDVESVTDVVNAFDPASKVTELKTTVNTTFGAISRSMSNVANAFRVDTPPDTITLLSSDNWIGDTDLHLQFPHVVVDKSRVIFSLIWSVIALVLTFKLWILICRIVVPVFQFVQKMVHLTVKA